MGYTLKLNWQPEAAIASLDETERAAVTSAMNRLIDGGSQDGVYSIDHPENSPAFSVLRVNDRLRLLFTMDAEHQIVTVHDLISREFVRRYG